MILSKSVARKQRFRTTRAVFWAAFLIRLFQITLTHVYRLLLTRYVDHRSLGWEMGRIAQALVTGRGYADPFFGQTGPTAWVPPLYPLLLAGVFKVFGVYTIYSAWVILAINCFFFALITRTIFEIAARCFNRSTAIWSAWIWVIYPTAVLCLVWETVLSTWLFTCILVLALRMRRIGEDQEDTSAQPVDSASSKDSRTLRRWLIFGFLWALLAFSNPSLLLFLPAAGIWILGWPSNAPKAGHRRQLGFAAASALLFVLCLSPWVARNWIAFHRFIPMRTDFGAELYLGNGPRAHGFSMMNEHPFESPEQFHLYQQMGEVGYSRMRGQMARKYIESDPRHFLWNTVKRVYYFWIGGPRPLRGPWYVEMHQLEYGVRYPIISIAGLLGLALALKRRIPGAWLFTWAFVLVPLLYYFVAFYERFRFPLEPLIVVLAVYLFQSTGCLLSTLRGLRVRNSTVATTAQES